MDEGNSAHFHHEVTEGLTCRFYRSCAFQENLEHAKAFNHLCERLTDDEFIASTQPTPTSDAATTANTGIGSTSMLCRAIIEVGPSFDISPAVLDDLRFQEAEISGTRAHSSRNGVDRNGGSNGVEYYNDEDQDHDSEDSQYELEHREGTPASEIYRELGMESRAAQTDMATPDVQVTNEGEEMLLDGEEPATAVGRTVVDANGDPLDVNEHTVSAFIGFVLQGEANHDHQNIDLDRNMDIDVDRSRAAPNESGSPVPDSDTGDEGVAHFALQPEMGVPGSISRQESIVEDLVASNDPLGNDGMDIDVVLETEETRRSDMTNGSMVIARTSNHESMLQVIALNRARQETASPRSSPAPEGIRA